MSIRGIVVLFSFFVMPMAWAFTECQLTPSQAWLALDGNNVWICFDRGNCVYKEIGGLVTDKHLGRMYAAGLTAISTGKSLVVRYSDVIACNALDANSKTNRIDGVWLIR